jgi:hypothetical protein
MTEIQQLLRTADSFAAIEHIHRAGSPLEIAALYQSLVIDLYWKGRDLPAVIFLGRAGIQHCLVQSLAPNTAPELVEKFRSVAKALAYNLASFTWPGWEEAGIAPTADQIAFGQDCAKLNLRLAIELCKPPLAVSKAHWLLGAHALASRQFDRAQTHFQQALTVLPATDTPSRAMATANAGYLALAQQCHDPANPEPHARFTDIAAYLSAQTDEDSPVYLSQLLTARQVFLLPS